MTTKFVRPPIEPQVMEDGNRNCGSSDQVLRWSEFGASRNKEIANRTNDLLNKATYDIQFLV